MSTIKDHALFTELIPEEAAVVSGGGRRHHIGGGGGGMGGPGPGPYPPGPARPTNTSSFNLDQYLFVLGAGVVFGNPGVTPDETQAAWESALGL